MWQIIVWKFKTQQLVYLPTEVGKLRKLFQKVRPFAHKKQVIADNFASEAILAGAFAGALKISTTDSKAEAKSQMISCLTLQMDRIRFAYKIG